MSALQEWLCEQDKLRNLCCLCQCSTNWGIYWFNGLRWPPTLNGHPRVHVVEFSFKFSLWPAAKLKCFLHINAAVITIQALMTLQTQHQNHSCLESLLLDSPTLRHPVSGVTILNSFRQSPAGCDTSWGPERIPAAGCCQCSQTLWEERLFLSQPFFLASFTLARECEDMVRNYCQKYRGCVSL